LVPRFLAAAASGASFLMGDSGISSPRTDISGMCCLIYVKLDAKIQNK
jgi:hypothetical protein